MEDSALLIAEIDVVIEVMALGRSASPDASAALSIFATSLSTVFDSSSIEDLTVSRLRFRLAQRSQLVDERVGRALGIVRASVSASDVSDDGLLNCSVRS